MIIRLEHAQFPVINNEFAADYVLADLIKYMLREPWHRYCQIITNYMPRRPKKGERPTIRIRFDDGTGHESWLRHSRGPLQGFGWDIGGDDFQCVALAVIALSEARSPPSLCPLSAVIPSNSERRLGHEDCKWCQPNGGSEDPPQWCREWEGCPYRVSDPKAIA
jgi:hypothetical protein